MVVQLSNADAALDILDPHSKPVDLNTSQLTTISIFFLISLKFEFSPAQDRFFLLLSYEEKRIKRYISKLLFVSNTMHCSKTKLLK